MGVKMSVCLSVCGNCVCEGGEGGEMGVLMKLLCFRCNNIFVYGLMRR